ncbi:MAG: serine hydrolase [Sphingomonas sp.]|nr:serine hydrolase [Sphingomonas sp.]
MRQQVLDPLAMTDSAWTEPEERFPRLATPYEVGPDTKLRPKTSEQKRQLNFSDRKLTMGGAGLAATADDYMRFARMMLGHGALNEVRILKPSTVRLMTTDQLDPKMTDRWWLPTKANSGSTCSCVPAKPRRKRKIAARAANSSGTAHGRPCSGSIRRTTWPWCFSSRRTPTTFRSTMTFAGRFTERITSVPPAIRQSANRG